MPVANPSRILIVDDNEDETRILNNSLLELGYETQTASDGIEALDAVERFVPDVILTDMNMPRMDGHELLAELNKRNSQATVIVLTGYGSIEKAVSLVQDSNAFWFLEKPVSIITLAPLLARAVSQSRLVQETTRMSRELSMQGVLGSLIGKSPAMQHLFSFIRQVAPTSAAVMITGESGTGKELVAQEIHRLSPRAAGPFVPINCAALPESLIESELFGHEKGAFTGAADRRPGCFEQAHGGTLLLDEIGEMPMPTQSKLLRVLEDLKVKRLGGKAEIKVDCRIISSTNRTPESAVKEKLLREDLYYRLNVFRIKTPALRERKEDIGLISEAMIHKFNKRHEARVTHLSPAALDTLQKHEWPGNVRELRNVVERAVILAGEGAIQPPHIRIDFPAEPDPNSGSAATA